MLATSAALEFVTALLPDNATFGKLKCMVFKKDERLACFFGLG